jgi:hypothetical protein
MLDDIFSLLHEKRLISNSEKDYIDQKSDFISYFQYFYDL